MSRRRIIRYRENMIVLSDCRSLIPVDAEPIKRAEQKRCKEVIHQMDLARERLRRFNEESEPAFQRWLNSTFGKQITELRELSQKRSDIYQLMSEIEHYKHAARCSYYEAYLAVMDRRNKREESPQENKQNEDHCSDDRDQSNTGDSSGDEESDLENGFRRRFESRFGPRSEWSGSKAEYDEAFEDFKESFKAAFGDGKFGSDEADPRGAERDFKQTMSEFDETNRKAVAERDLRIKTIYRTLARKLHPDINVELDRKRKDLWHQVQDAYDAKDIDRLETLSAMSEVFDDNAESVESVWSLKNLYEELRDGLRHLQKQINRCNKDFAWSFEKTIKKPEKLQRLHQKLSSQMKWNKTELLDHIEYGERQTERWKNPPSPRKGKKRNQSAPTPTPSPNQSQWTKAQMDAFTGFGKKGD